MQNMFINKQNSVLRKLSWSMLKKYSERAHKYYDIDPLLKAVELGFSSLRQDEIEKFLKSEKEKAKTPFLKKDFENVINIFNYKYKHAI